MALPDNARRECHARRKFHTQSGSWSVLHRTSRIFSKIKPSLFFYHPAIAKCLPSEVCVCVCVCMVCDVQELQAVVQIGALH